MKRLGHLIEDSMAQGRLKPLCSYRNGPALTHIFFVDDLFLFGEADNEQACLMNDILDTFCMCSGKIVNKSKS